MRLPAPRSQYLPEGGGGGLPQAGSLGGRRDSGENDAGGGGQTWTHFLGFPVSLQERLFNFPFPLRLSWAFNGPESKWKALCTAGSACGGAKDAETRRPHQTPPGEWPRPWNPCGSKALSKLQLEATTFFILAIFNMKKFHHDKKCECS